MKILKYKKIKNKYKVYFDNDSSIDLYENTILNNNLLLKKDISESDLDKIKKDNEKEEIYERSLKYINIKMRSKEEIKKYLSKYKYNKSSIEYVIKKLENSKIINDELYIKAYIYDKINLSNDGPNKIKYYLLSEKMDENLINNYIDEIDEEVVKNKLNRLVDKKIKTIKNCSGNVLKQKITMYFINLGYSKEMIEEVLSNKNVDNNEEGVKLYNKLYNKYSKKYQGYELENLLRQKMFQKGFDLSEIKKNID